MPLYYVIIGLTYFVVGLAVSILFYYVLKRPFLGRFWGALAVGLIGSYMGGTLDFVLLDFDVVPAIAGTVDVVPPALVSVASVWVFSLISRRETD
jgi:hypothetical protein